MPNRVRQRILLAEDDEAQREILSELLEFEGYDVVTAATPDEVLRSLASDPPDAILLDVWGVSSPNVLTTLQRMPGRPACVLVSGDGTAGQLAARIGAEDFLAKPYDVEALLCRLRNAIDRRRSAADPGAQFGAP
jgi:DNA-binding response OmpR family regulator